MTPRVLAAVWVPGVPRTQGSMTHIGKGRMQHSDSLVAWRTLVRDELRQYVLSPSGFFGDGLPWLGPVAVRCIFVRADGKGDIDKLARAVLDALTESRVIVDDLQVVTLKCDRVERVERRGDGVFILVGALDPIESVTASAFGDEIDGWVSR